jgi:hypothetical protein
MAFAGVMSLLVGVILLREAHIASLRHTVVPSRGASWMSPPQAYVAATLCIGFGLLAVALWIWKRLAK